MKKSDQYILFIALTIIVFLGILSFLYIERKFSTPQVIRAEPTLSSYIVVHISGGVKRPGVYKLPRGSRIYEAIDMAGGPVKVADLDALNLAEILNDGEKILVPIRNDNISTIIGSMDDRLDINVMDEEELKKLPGIGNKLAKRIIKYKNVHGPFKTLDELKNVSGIGDKKLKEIKEYITSHR